MARVNWLMIAPPAVFAAMAALFAAGMMREDPDSLPSARAGQTAPPVVLTMLGTDAPFTDATLRDGQVKLVNFWASWCAPCRVEHPNLDALKAQGIPIYGVNYKDKPDNALGFLAELGNPYAAIGADAAGRMALDWGVYGVPETYVVDGDGTIIARLAGPVTQRTMDSTLAPALEQLGVTLRP